MILKIGLKKSGITVGCDNRGTCSGAGICTCFSDDTNGYLVTDNNTIFIDETGKCLSNNTYLNPNSTISGNKCSTANWYYNPNSRVMCSSYCNSCNNDGTESEPDKYYPEPPIIMHSQNEEFLVLSNSNIHYDPFYYENYLQVEGPYCTVKCNKDRNCSNDRDIDSKCNHHGRSQF